MSCGLEERGKDIFQGVCDAQDNFLWTETWAVTVDS